MAAQDEDFEYDEEASTERELQIKGDGMPFMDDDEVATGISKSTKMVPAFLVIPRVINLTISYLIYYWRKDTYEARMTKHVAMIDGVGYLFLAAGVFSVLVEVTNMIPGRLKGAILPGNAGNLRSNMAIYKVQTGKADAPLPYVVMEDQGNIGNYNRSNRALAHFVENGMQVLVCFLLAGCIFGEAVFALVFLYAIFRIWYQIAYSTGGYGMGCCQHGMPFMLHTVFVAHILEMLVWIAAVRMVQIQLNAPAVAAVVAP